MTTIRIELQRLKDRIDTRLNDCLCEMKEGYDDSIVGFNEAWDIVRKVFDEALSPAPAAPSSSPQEDPNMQITVARR